MRILNNSHFLLGLIPHAADFHSGNTVGAFAPPWREGGACSAAAIADSRAVAVVVHVGNAAFNKKIFDFKATNAHRRLNILFLFHHFFNNLELLKAPSPFGEGGGERLYLITFFPFLI